MPIIALELKANLVNVTNLQPGDYDDHRWYLKIQCTSCRNAKDHWQYATVTEAQPLTKGHGIAHIMEKCPFCGRSNNSLEILKDTYAPYKIEKNEEFQTIVKFDCRGLEPVEFDPRVGWRCEGVESGTVFEDIDLNEKEWADYDEKANQPVEINSISARFTLAKK
uniref:Uncharacterized protein n=1 Tax=Acrobeloides nanus TaxID=290746 RepID=A0A914DUJ7_9BILA